MLEYQLDSLNQVNDFLFVLLYPFHDPKKVQSLRKGLPNRSLSKEYTAPNFIIVSVVREIDKPNCCALHSELKENDIKPSSNKLPIRKAYVFINYH